MATSPAGRMLSRQLQQMQSDKDIPGISCGLADNNVFEWEVMLMISDDVKLYGGEWPRSGRGTTSSNPLFNSLFNPLFGGNSPSADHSGHSPPGIDPQTDSPTVGGFFRARLSFPSEYPHLPPKMKFETPLFHPNSMCHPPEVWATSIGGIDMHTNYRI
jgi:ubiquitin-conjugating enzyme E2 G1